MPPPVAAAIFIAGILGLFWLDRNEKVKTSGGLWIPLLWFSIACSRPVGVWLQMGGSIDAADQMQEGSPLDRLVWAILLVLGIIVLAGRGKRLTGFLRSNGPMLLFYLYCVMSFIWSDFADVALKRWIKAVGDVIMVLIVLTDNAPIAAFNRLLSRMTFVLLPLSILFIKYYPTIGVFYFPWGGKPNFGGVTTNKNSLGVISLCFGLWAWWRFIDAYQNRAGTGRTRRLIAHGAILAMAFWLFNTSNSMTSLNSFLMASTLLLVASIRLGIRRPMMVHALLVSMLAISASVLFLDVSPDVLKAMGRNPTLTDRTEIWHVVLSLSDNSLIGTGFESFWLGPRLEKMWRMYWWHPQEAHNGYLEIFLMLGWIGICLLAMVIVSGYWNIFRAWRRGAPMSTLRIAYFLVGLVYNFTEASFFRMQAVSWIFFLFAIVNVPSVLRHKDKAPSDHLNRVERIPEVSTWAETSPGDLVGLKGSECQSTVAACL